MAAALGHFSVPHGSRAGSTGSSGLAFPVGCGQVPRSKSSLFPLQMGKLKPLEGAPSPTEAMAVQGLSLDLLAPCTPHAHWSQSHSVRDAGEGQHLGSNPATCLPTLSLSTGVETPDSSLQTEQNRCPAGERLVGMMEMPWRQMELAA